MEIGVDLGVELVEGSLHFLLDLGLILVRQPHLAIDIDWLTKGDVAGFAAKELSELQWTLVNHGHEGNAGHLGDHDRTTFELCRVARAGRKDDS